MQLSHILLFAKLWNKEYLLLNLLINCSLYYYYYYNFDFFFLENYLFFLKLLIDFKLNIDYKCILVM